MVTLSHVKVIGLLIVLILILLNDSKCFQNRTSKQRMYLNKI